MIHEYPEPTNKCVMISIDSSLIPIVVGELRRLELRSSWADDADYERGYNAMAELRIDMACASEIASSIDRLYMMLDNRLSGAIYEAQQGAAPALPVVPAPLASEYGGLLPDILALRGGTPDGWFGLPGSTPISLREIVSALRAGQPDELDTMLEKIDLLGDATDVASLYSAVKGTAVDLASLAEGGGTLATLVVATLAQAAMMGMQAAQLDALIARMDRLIASLDGGAAVRPETDVIAQLIATNGALV